MEKETKHTPERFSITDNLTAVINNQANRIIEAENSGKALLRIIERLEGQLSEMKKEREEWKAALIEAKWFVDHVMGKEKRVNWGNSFGINWGRVNTALIAIDKVKI